MTDTDQYVNSTKAAEILGVTVPTLYAYVSRGLVQSIPGMSGRERQYSMAGLRRLRASRAKTRDTSPGLVPLPFAGIDTQIAEVSAGTLYYRGQNAVHLATSKSVGDVAALLWQGSVKRAPELFSERLELPVMWCEIARTTEQLSRLDAFQIALPIAAEADPGAYHLSPEGAARTGARILHLLTDVASFGQTTSRSGIAETLQRAWAPKSPRVAEVIRSAVILCADHQASLTTNVARTIAAAGASPYSVVGGALAATQGVRYGGVSGRIVALLSQVERPADAVSVIQSRLQRGEEVPGFGHPLYPGGDPRAEALLSGVRNLAGSRRETKRIDAIVEAADSILGEAPTLDFALVAMAKALDLPDDAGLTIFAIGRSIGWIGHAIQVYEQDG